MKEYESYKRIGTEPHRSYYIPFDEGDSVKMTHGIIDRSSSSRFLLLDGTWQIKQHTNVEEVDINESLDSTIPVPSCVQMHGYDHIQYLNTRYPIPAIPPYVPYENPCWHYRRTFALDKAEGERYYLNFEGVDSAFYLYVNGSFKGYSQISHAISEFDITDLVVNGENTLDVLVLKWCASTYLECQDKFRFSGIFRSVYILKRPEQHLTDYKIETELDGNDAILNFINESDVDIVLSICSNTALAKAGEGVSVRVGNIQPWTAEAPTLYDLEISACGERIIERIGFRTVSIDGKVFKVNGEAIKLKGVNRHDFNCNTAATVTLDDMALDISLMKELNVNAVRTSHYPNAPEFNLLCDAVGIYVMCEADLEMHGACARKGAYSADDWMEYADMPLFSEGITDRYRALVERDKNRTSVIIWSLGNESSFGEAFIEGAKYVRSRDNTRPVHYEGIVRYADPKYYHTDLLDMISMMYPSIETIKKTVLDNPEETRPFVLCEYTHAMGNSCGDIADYWKLIYEEEQMMGAFVWEWADHAIKTEKGFLYGGDFGEIEHDDNFCVDGLLTPDRKFKSGALEMKTVYAGKLTSEIREVEIPNSVERESRELEIKINEHTGEITSITLGKEEVLRTPAHLNIYRYTDNDRHHLNAWKTTYRIVSAKPHIFSCDKTNNGYKLSGAMAANCREPVLYFELEYAVSGNELTMSLEYEVAAYVNHFPRVGFEFAIDKKYSQFSYVGFGPTESYVDKHVACDYGYYTSSAEENYESKYIRPQESGSHYATKYLNVKDLLCVTAESPFSFSINPYTTSQLWSTAHNFELEENEFVNVCIDVAMRGVGSHSCGPVLDAKYEIPRKAKNTFKITF